MWKETGKRHILALSSLFELFEKEYEIEGKLRNFEHVARPPGVRIIFEKDKKILLTKEYRGEHKVFDYRLPGGKVFDSISEMKNYTGEMIDAAKKAAILEAKEECGIIVSGEDLKLFRISHCGATIEWDLYYFIVRKFHETDVQELGEGEYITYEWYSRDEVANLVSERKMAEDRTKGVLWEYYLSMSYG